MRGWIDTREPMLGRISDVSRELSDPIRLTVMQLLAYEGPHGMSQLAQVLRVSPSRLGNHLVRLRDTGLVTTRRSGRSVIYAVADPRVRLLLDELAAFAEGTVSPAGSRDVGVLCRDHLAGSLGVGVLDTLLDRDAVRYRDDPRDGLELGANATAEFARFGIEVSASADTSELLLEACLDREVRRPHLGGRLGHEMLRSLRRQRLIRQSSGRYVPVHTRRAELERLVPPVGPEDRPGSSGG